MALRVGGSHRKTRQAHEQGACTAVSVVPGRRLGATVLRVSSDLLPNLDFLLKAMGTTAEF